MFDIGFWEIALIAVVALLVVGPEEFPRLVRTIGATLGKIRRFVQEAKQELDREVIRADELKRLMEKEAKIAELHEAVEELNATIPVDPVPPGLEGAEGGREDRKKGENQAPARDKPSDKPSATERDQPQDHDVAQAHGTSKKEISP